MEATTHFSHNLKELLLFSDFSVKAMAEWLELSDSTFRKYVYGNRDNLSFAQLYNISRRLYISPFDLMYRPAFWCNPMQSDCSNDCTNLLSILHNSKYTKNYYDDLISEYYCSEPMLIENIKSIIYHDTTSKGIVMSLLSDISNISLILKNQRQPSAKTACTIAYRIINASHHYNIGIFTLMVSKLSLEQIDDLCLSLKAIAQIKDSSLQEVLPTLILSREDLYGKDCSIIKVVENINNYFYSSDFENIKKYLKILYTIDETIFDYYNFLLYVSRNTYKWIPQYCYNYVVYSKSDKVTERDKKAPAVDITSPFYNNYKILKKYDIPQELKLDKREHFKLQKIWESNNKYIISEQSCIIPILNGLDYIKNHLNDENIDYIIENTKKTYQEMLTASQFNFDVKIIK